MPRGIDPTPRSAYEHWNEERDIMWWEEVGKHASSQADEPWDDYDPYEDSDNEDPDAYYEPDEEDE